MTAIQKAREALVAARDTLSAASRQLTDDHKIVLGGKRWGETTIAKIDAALAALDAPAEGEASAPPAPDGLEPVAWRYQVPSVNDLWTLSHRRPGEQAFDPGDVVIEPLYSAATLSAQEAEIERLHAEANAVSAAIGSPRFMDPPDGGSVTLAEQVERMRHALESAEAKMTEARKVIEPFAYLQQTYAGEISPPSIETVRAVRRWLAAIRNLEPRHD